MTLEIDTIKAVPTPRFEVGAKLLVAQLLNYSVRSSNAFLVLARAHITNGKRENTPPMTRNSAKYPAA